MKQLDENIWIECYPLSVLGAACGRNVTVVRLQSGLLVVHSMAPFSAWDVAQIRAIGEPGWLMEATMFHDTYAKQGRVAFPGIPFLGPGGFQRLVDFSAQLLLPAPPEWRGELEVFPVGGLPRPREHVCLHVPSRTLIVADLLFNFPPGENGWDRFFRRYLAGLKRYPAMSRIFRFCIRNRNAFRVSMATICALDFDRIVVGHGSAIERNGKELLTRALDDAGLI